MLSPTDIDIARTMVELMGGLPLTLDQAGFYIEATHEQAEFLFQRALTIRQQCLGTKHPDIAETLYQLARFYQLQQQITKALSLYQKALKVYKRYLDSEAS